MSDFEYEEAYQKAPEQVKRRIEEFHELSEEQKQQIPLLWYVLGTGTPAYKMSKEDSEYTDEAEHPENMCKHCEFMYYKVANGKHICSQIRGEIEPEGWCNQFKRAEDEQSNEEN